MLHILGYPGEHIRSNHKMNALIHPVNTVRFQYWQRIVQTQLQETVESRQGIYPYSLREIEPKNQLLN